MPFSGLVNMLPKRRARRALRPQPCRLARASRQVAGKPEQDCLYQAFRCLAVARPARGPAQAGREQGHGGPVLAVDHSHRLPLA